VVDRHLREHAASCRSGSAERLLPYLDKLLRFEWDRAQHRQRRRQALERPEKPRPGNSLDEYTTRSRATRFTEGIIEADWMGDY
jgi:hypothetical protein